MRTLGRGVRADVVLLELVEDAAERRRERRRERGLFSVGSHNRVSELYPQLLTGRQRVVLAVLVGQHVHQRPRDQHTGDVSGLERLVHDIVSVL